MDRWMVGGWRWRRETMNRRYWTEYRKSWSSGLLIAVGWDGCIEPIDDVHMSQALTTNEIRSDINSESNVKDPEVGMTFPSWDAVDSYYHAYGKQRGFGVVRAAVSYKQKAGKSTREKREGGVDSGNSSNLVMERNGVENLGVSERDVRNVIDKKRCMKMQGGDANAMLVHFDKMVADNQNFYHRYRLDDDGNLKDVMWVVTRCRATYEEFGDVALSIVMPQSRHRWCIWHVLKKFSEKLGMYSNYKDFKSELLHAIYYIFTEEEFEKNWMLVITVYELKENEWLSAENFNW
ncbi:Protein FAR1-RELATED SEQUENCE 1 [Bienertia sinuspersici]